MLTRSSTCSSAGSSVLKSKWVILSKYDSLPDVVAVEDLAERLERRVVAEQLPVDLVAEVGRAVDQPEVARVEVLEQARRARTPAAAACSSRSASRFGMIDS